MANNQAPTDITLDNITIDENQLIGTTVGILTAIDPNLGETFTYDLVTGLGDTNNASFTIEDNQLQTNADFDFETKNSYSIRVRATDEGGLSFEKQFTININNINEASLPIIKTPIDDLIVQTDATNTTLNLLNYFDDPSTTGQVAQFELYNTSLAGGIINVLLFDQAQTGAPLTVENFLTYVNDGDYTNTFIHRSVPGFVVQGGGFMVTNEPDPYAVYSVLQNPSVENEFSPNRSNLRGTIAMAKLGGDPDSATNQWFFNLDDNGANLDNQNGGFTVFGQVLSATDLAVIDAIASVPTYTFQSPFGSIPLDIMDVSELDSPDDFVRFKSITPLTFNELTFSVVSNSNPTLVNASINNNQLILDYLDDQNGTSEITIRGTSLLGYTVEDTFNITVEPNNLPPTDINLSNDNIPEDSPIDTIVATLESTDSDMGETFIYSLVAGDGDTDNSLFTIEGNSLKTNATFDFETKDTYVIRVQTTDSANNTYSKSLIININDVMENNGHNLLWRNQSTGKNVVWYMDGATRTDFDNLPQVTNLDWQIVGTGDANDDQKTDIYWRNQATGQNVVWYMDGVNRTGFDNLPTVANTDWEIVGIGDADNDSLIDDIYWRNQATGKNVVWYMDDTTRTGFDNLPTVANMDWDIVGIADGNGDGKTDLYWRNQVTGQNVLWYMDGANRTDFDNLPQVANTDWKIVGTGDGNGDGKTDLYWRNQVTGKNVLWYMDGANRTGVDTLSQVTNTDWYIVA